MMYYIDTEFIEDGKTIELLSLALVSADGKRELYIEVQDAPFHTADQWVKDNVIAHLWHKQKDHAEHNRWSRDGGQGGLMPKSEVAAAVRRFIGEDQPQFVGYYADYDWVVFCQLFGRMIDLPKGYPMFCIDLKQMMWEYRLTDDWKKTMVPQENEHNALADARWNRDLHKAILGAASDKIAQGTL